MTTPLSATTGFFFWRLLFACGSRSHESTTSSSAALTCASLKDPSCALQALVHRERQAFVAGLLGHDGVYRSIQ